MKSKKMNKWDLVELEWRDAVRQLGSWKEEKEFNYKEADQFADGFKATGYVTKITDNHIYIAQQWSTGDNAISNILSIPLKHIIKSRILKKKR